MGFLTKDEEKVKSHLPLLHPTGSPYPAMLHIRGYVLHRGVTQETSNVSRLTSGPECLRKGSEDTVESVGLRGHIQTLVPPLDKDSGVLLAVDK